MEIKAITPKEIMEGRFRFSARTISTINNILEERFEPGKSVLITFEEFCNRWDDYNGSYEKLIKKEYNNIDELYSFYGWSVTKGDKGMIFEIQ